MRRQDRSLLQPPLLFDSSESLPFGELSLTEGAGLIKFDEREKRSSKFKHVGAAIFLSNFLFPICTLIVREERGSGQPGISKLG